MSKIVSIILIRTLVTLGIVSVAALTVLSLKVTDRPWIVYTMAFALLGNVVVVLLCSERPPTTKDDQQSDEANPND